MDVDTYWRFMAKVSMSVAGDGHWYWIGSVTQGGYGNLSVRGMSVYAHRLAYEHWNGPIPEHGEALQSPQ